MEREREICFSFFLHSEDLFQKIFYLMNFCKITFTYLELFLFCQVISQKRWVSYRNLSQTHTVLARTSGQRLQIVFKGKRSGSGLCSLKKKRVQMTPFLLGVRKASLFRMKLMTSRQVHFPPRKCPECLVLFWEMFIKKPEVSKKYIMPWEPTTFIFRGYNPYIGG